MLSEAENRQLTEVGPGTPMGELLRRYWHPVAPAAELDERATRPVRLLGEDLVLFRCGEESFGLLERFCAHRRTDLVLGSIEDCTLRCPRHGWAYTEEGICFDQPLEPVLMEASLRAYKAVSKAGLIWAYLGPDPPPLLPDWEPFGWDDGLVQIALCEITCNWLQCQENSVDAVDMELIQAAFEEAARNGTSFELPAADFNYNEYEHGFMVREAAESQAAVTKTSIWPNGVFEGDAHSARLEWRVPIDDTRTLEVAWFVDRPAPGAAIDYSQRVHHWYAPTRDEEGEALRTHRLNQKFAIWLNQATIMDRSRETLSEGDEGVVMFRDKLFSQMALIADGGEPKGVLRDPTYNRSIQLPYTQAAVLPGATPSHERDAAFSWITGQTEDAATEYAKVKATWRDAGEPREQSPTS